jgi:hypothetical protein
VIKTAPVARHGAACVEALALLVVVVVATVLTWSEGGALALSAAVADIGEPPAQGQFPVPADGAGRVIALSMTATGPETFTYDVPSTVRAEVHEIATRRAGPARFNAVRDRSASPSTDARGTSTTPNSRSVATNTIDDIAGAVSRAASNVGPGSGPVYGTRVHSAFADEIAALGRSDLYPEVSYLNGKVVPYGTPGSVRLDVVVGSPSAPTAIWDLKTGSAALTPARIAQILIQPPAWLPEGASARGAAMTPAEWKRFASPVLDENWQFSRLLAYWHPVSWVLHGVLAERSSSGGFYLWDLRMPLYVESSVIDLSWSERVGGGTRLWNVDGAGADAVARTGRSVAAAAQSAGSVLLPPPGGADNVRMQETRAYGLVLEGASAAAVEVLGRVCRYDATYPWVHDLVARATENRDLLLAQRPSDLLDRLASWRASTARAIGVRLT